MPDDPTIETPLAPARPDPAPPIAPVGATSVLPRPPGPPPPSTTMDQGGALPPSNAATTARTYPVQYGGVPESTGQLSLAPDEQLKNASFGARVYHGVLNALSGTQDVAMTGYDAKGNPIYSTTQMGPGQQWKKIISGAITGLAAGLGQPGGPGAAGRAFSAGFQTTQQQELQRQERQRQQAQQTFSNQQAAAKNSAETSMLTNQAAEVAFRTTRMKVDAAQADIDRMNQFNKMIAEGGQGTRYLNHYPSMADVVTAFQNDPSLHDTHTQGQIVAIPHIDVTTGKVDGLDAAYVTKDWFNSKTDKPVQVTTSVTMDGKVQDVSFTVPAGQMTNGQWAQLMMAQSKDSLELKAKQAGITETEARTKLTQAQTGEAEAATKEKLAEAGEGMSQEQLVDAFGKGQLDPEKMQRTLAKQPGLLSQIIAKYPDFDAKKIGAYGKAYTDFTTGKAGQALNAGATAVVHLRDLQRMNTNLSHVPGTGDYNAYHNLLDTLAGELTRFYGTESVEARQHIVQTLGSTMPGTRQAAIDAQSSAMSRKFTEFEQQWKNAAPSKAYEAQMPQISDEAKEARTMLDPEYAQRVYQLPARAQAQIRNAGGTVVKFNNGQRWQWKNGAAHFLGVETQPQQ